MAEWPDPRLNCIEIETDVIDDGFFKLFEVVLGARGDLTWEGRQGPTGRFRFRLHLDYIYEEIANVEAKDLTRSEDIASVLKIGLLSIEVT